MASLGKDLAALRKEQDLSFEDIYETTKIPRHIITSIEDDTIFTDFDENSTYIRSYVRSYARALAIDDQKIIYALDKQKNGNYSGSLRRADAAEPESPSEPIKEGEDKEGEPNVDEQTPSEDLGEPDTASGPDKDPDAPLTPKEELASPTSDRSENVDWGNMGREINPSPPKSNLWIGALILLFILAGGLYYFLSSSDETDSASEQTVPENESPTPPDNEADSLQLNIIPPTEQDTAEAVSGSMTNPEDGAQQALSDTLEFVVYAAYGHLDPVRVYTDVMNNINPYWIEEGEAVLFDFVNEFRIRGNFDDIVLLMNGHVIEDVRDRFYNPDTRMVEITRSLFEEDNKWLQPPPDTLAIDAPFPSLIRERPTYN